MNECNPILEEAIYAFQDPRIVSFISEVTGIRECEPDQQLYAGRLSLMAQGHFLNPHVDNSHDKARLRYRVLNLLYYVSPDWREEFGGSLELWPDGPKGSPVVIPSKFNRLAVMATTPGSWHSANRIAAPLPRCCISNYYFQIFRRKPRTTSTSHRSAVGPSSVHDLILRTDIAVRMFLRKLRPLGVVENKHFYKRPRWFRGVPTSLRDSGNVPMLSDYGLGARLRRGIGLAAAE